MEVERLERKYQEFRKPLYKRRRELVNNTDDPEEKELADLQRYEDPSASKPMDIPHLEELKSGKEIPSFWVTAIRNNGFIRRYVSLSDRKILESLVDVAGEKEEGNNYKLTFVFAENEYFTNKELTVSLIVDKQNDLKCLKVIGTTIDWKDKPGATVTTAASAMRKRL